MINSLFLPKEIIVFLILNLFLKIKYFKLYDDFFIFIFLLEEKVEEMKIGFYAFFIDKKKNNVPNLFER